MIDKNKMYLNGTTRGDTFRVFLFHVVMMFVLPLLVFFFSRDMFASYDYSEKYRNIYSGFISVFCVILVMVSYVLSILGDQDNWTQPTETNIRLAKNDKGNNTQLIHKKEEIQTKNAKNKKNKNEENKKEETDNHSKQLSINNQQETNKKQQESKTTINSKASQATTKNDSKVLNNENNKAAVKAVVKEENKQSKKDQSNDKNKETKKKR